MSATVIIGRNAVKQFLNSKHHIEKIYIRERQTINQDLRQIIATAKKNGILVQWIAPHKFDDRFQGDHQGIACISHNFEQYSLADIIKESPHVVLALDHLNDHNFGAICQWLKPLAFTILSTQKIGLCKLRRRL